MSAKFLFALPDAQVIYQDEHDEKGAFVGRKILDVVSSFRGILWAIESIAHGEKVQEIREFRKRLIASHDERNHENDAKFLLLTGEEKGFLDQAVKTYDWTFGGKVQFWVRWDSFFDSLFGIKAYDEKNPDATYVEWKREWDAKQAAKLAEQARLEQEAIEKKRAAELAAAKELADEVDVVLTAKLGELQAAGKFGTAATIADLPAEIRAAAETTAKQNIAERKNAPETKTDAPVEAKAEAAVPSVEADEII